MFKMFKGVNGFKTFKGSYKNNPLKMYDMGYSLLVIRMTHAFPSLPCIGITLCLVAYVPCITIASLPCTGITLCLCASMP